jgi:nucleoside-diphosphate-sugar epimerase
VILVTGAAGFIGAHVAGRLAVEGRDVRAVDRADADLATADLDPLLDGVDTVVHLAARPGVRPSWDEFEAYVADNVVGTERLLAAVARARRVRRVVYASSSSVYGNALAHPTTEDALPAPVSPYGVTKLAGEHLCGAFDVPVVVLRYFTVYGPGQRPDMAFHRMIAAALGDGPPFPLYGDGSQVRDFTFVDDVVTATIAAADSTDEVAPGTVFNVAGGSSASVAEVLDLVGRLTGAPVPLDRRPAQPGDVHRTGGSTDRIAAALGWAPTVDLETGVARQIEWHRRRRRGQ